MLGAGAHLCVLWCTLACVAIVQASVLEERSAQLESGALDEFIEHSLCQGLDPDSACLCVRHVCCSTAYAMRQRPNYMLVCAVQVR